MAAHRNLILAEPAKKRSHGATKTRKLMKISVRFHSDASLILRDSVTPCEDLSYYQDTDDEFNVVNPSYSLAS